MAHIGNYLPSPGSAVWRRDVATSPTHGHGGSVASQSENVIIRHVVIRDAQIWEEPAPYVVYRIDVLTEYDHWFLFRRYSQFYSLHKQLVKQYGVNKDILPPKKLSGNLSKHLIDNRRILLEQYLQKIIHSEPLISRSPELQVFLDVPTHNVIKVADVLTRHLYLHGDKLLEESIPIALTVNEMYAITRRLQLPWDAIGIDSDDVSADPAHLYSFVHQLKCLRINFPPSPCSVCCMPFDMGPFKSIHTLKLDHVPISQVGGLLLIQQQLQKLSVHNSLRSLQELLVNKVEERRGSISHGEERREVAHSPLDLVESWRIAGTSKLIGNRVVVHPWHKLHTLILTHNLLTELDNTLQLLPQLRELNLSYNRLQVLNLQNLCLPNLEKLNVSHNKIHTIQDNRKCLERITHLNLSHNRLHSMDGIGAFVGVCVLNLSFNLLSLTSDLSMLVQLRRLNTLGMAGNPITSSSACRVLLLAKFMHKSRMISMDGLEPSMKEQAKIKSYKSKYGSNPDLWPIAKSLEAAMTHLQPHLRRQLSSYSSSERHPGNTSSHKEVQGGIQKAMGNGSNQLLPPDMYGTTHSRDHSPSSMRTNQESLDHFSFPSSSSEQSLTNVKGVFLTPQLPRKAKNHGHRSLSQSFSSAQGEERYSVGVYCHVNSREDGSREGGFVSRSEPDGQSDISSTSLDLLVQRSSRTSPDQRLSHGSPLSPPPSTPVYTSESSCLGGGGVSTAITPAMIQSALDALEGIQDKDTPLSLTPHQYSSDVSRQGSVLPEAVTNALTEWINSQSSPQEGSGGHSYSSLKGTPHLTPPPSTPSQTLLRDNTSSNKEERQGISAGELITALSALMVTSGEEGKLPGSRGSLVGTAPCTTNERLSEWAKLGIKPDEVIQALSALTIQNEDEEGEDGHRVCTQLREQTSTPEPQPFLPAPTTPEPRPFLPDPANYLCLFPESKDLSSSPGGYQAKEENWMTEEGTHLEEEVLISRHHHMTFNPGPPSQSDNEFAELDPFLTSSSQTVSTGGVSGEGLEVGVDVTVKEIPFKEEEDSPVDSVLYSHSPH